MPEMIAIVYPKKETAFEVRQKLTQLQADFLIELADAVVVTKETGKDGQDHRRAPSGGECHRNRGR